jgi:hypothetical protein
MIGALVLDRIERQPDRHLSARLDAWLRAELPRFLTRANDRNLFDDILGPTKPDAAKEREQGRKKKPCPCSRACACWECASSLLSSRGSRYVPAAVIPGIDAVILGIETANLIAITMGRMDGHHVSQSWNSPSLQSKALGHASSEHIVAQGRSSRLTRSCACPAKRRSCTTDRDQR